MDNSSCSSHSRSPTNPPTAAPAAPVIVASASSSTTSAVLVPHRERIVSRIILLVQQQEQSSTICSLKPPSRTGSSSALLCRRFIKFVYDCRTTSCGQKTLNLCIALHTNSESSSSPSAPPRQFEWIYCIARTRQCGSGSLNRPLRDVASRRNRKSFRSFLPPTRNLLSPDDWRAHGKFSAGRHSGCRKVVFRNLTNSGQDGMARAKQIICSDIVNFPQPIWNRPQVGHTNLCVALSITVVRVELEVIRKIY